MSQVLYTIRQHVDRTIGEEGSLIEIVVVKIRVEVFRLECQYREEGVLCVRACTRVVLPARKTKTLRCR